MGDCECGGNCKSTFEQPLEFVAGELITNGQSALSSVISSLTSLACSMSLEANIRNKAVNKLGELIDRINYEDFI